MTTCSNCGDALEARTRFCPSCGTKVVADGLDTDPMVGRTLAGKYRVDAKIGEGSMGQVYRAEHVGLKKRVALKVLHSDMQVTEETLQRFQREGIAAGRFNHPNAIQIFDFDHDGGDFFLAMEFIEGSDLKAFLREEAPLDVDVAVDITRQVLAALVEAHGQGIVHRDLKPENVMVARSGAGVSVKVLDFGLSKLVHAPLSASLQTQPGRIMGTPLYMSPEQSTGDVVDHRSDLYSLGIILYEMLAGSLPFQGESITELLLNQVTARIPALHEVVPGLQVPAELQALLDRALAKDREERFQSAEEMLEELDALDLANTSSAGSAALRARPSTRRTKRPAKGAPAPETSGSQARLITIAAGVVVVVVAAVFVPPLLSGGSDSTAYARVRERPQPERSELEARYVSLLDRSLAALRTGTDEEALSLANEALGLECKDPEALLVRARAYQARRDIDAARADLREALRQDSAFAAADIEFGWLELAAGDLDAAREHFAAAEATAPDSSAARAGQGALAYLTGDAEAAEPLLRKATEQGGVRANYYLGRLLLDRGDVSAAIPALVDAKRADPRHAGALAALGAAYLSEGRASEAERQLRDALELDPRLPDARVALATILVSEERFDQALRVLEAGFASERTVREKALLAVVRLELGAEPSDVAALLEEARDEIGDDPDLLILLGILHQSEGRFADALDAYEAALELNDNLALPHTNRGLVLFARGDYAEAARALEQGIALDAEDADAHLTLAVLYQDYLGQNDRALDLLRDYQLLGGTKAEAEARLQR